MDGIWQPTGAELRGQKLPDGSLDKLELILSGATYALKISGTTADQGVIEFFPEAEPKAMRITGLTGPNKGRTIPAIYQLNDETLTICYDLGGERAPSSFKTEADSQLYLVTYHRKSH